MTERYIVLDLETTGHGSHLRNLNPWDERNLIVAIIRKPYDTHCSVTYNETGFSRYMDLQLDNYDVLVGQNIRYDLSYFWRNPSLIKFFKRGGRIYDTWIAEYLLDGQKATQKAFGNVQVSRNLDALSKKYGGTQKVDDAHDYFKNKNGLGFLNLPREKWDEYTYGDGLNTEIVYNAQKKLINDKLGLLLDQHFGYMLATLEAEYNGMRLDTTKVAEIISKCDKREAEIHTRLKEITTKTWADSPVPFSPTSNDHVSVVLYGGNVLYKEAVVKTEVVDGNIVQQKTKAGILKTKIEKKTRYVQGILPASASKFGAKKLGFYSVSEAVLQRVRGSKEAEEFCQLILELRQLNKMTGTYCRPFLYEGIYPDGTIKGGYNHAQTVTGRLSSRDPNMQNMSGDLHGLFIPTYQSGVKYELDLKTIEVVLGANLSHDDVLIEELMGGLDMHTRNAQTCFGVTDVPPELRKKAKAATFAKWYGAGAKQIAALTNMTEPQAQTFIDKFERKYHKFVSWGKKLVDEVGGNESYDSATNSIFGHMRTFYGKHYVFEKVQTKYGFKYNTNQILNLQIQGLCADILACVARQLFYYAVSTDYAFKITGFIHDSILLDFRSQEDANLHLPSIRAILYSIDSFFLTNYNFKFDVPIAWDAKRTEINWGEMTNVDI